MDALSCALIPGCCTLCGSSLPRLSSVPICDSCWSECSAHNSVLCARCGEIPAPAETHSLCRACRLAPPPFARAVSFGPYRDPLRGAIHALKFRSIAPTAKRLGVLLATAIAPLRAEMPDNVLVIPIPLHRIRQRQRGFNQAEELARHALKALHRLEPGWKLTLAPRSLLRLVNTPPQVSLTARQRRLNLRNAFAVADAAAVRGRDILLLDDVMTTGATARSAAQKLLRAGAESVRVATLARATRNVAVLRGADRFFEDAILASDYVPASASFVSTRQDSLHGQSSF